MGYAARYIFQSAYDAHQEFTELFDFIAPTAISLWNLRWQVTGFLAGVPEATSEALSSRFALGSGMRGGEIRRACIDTSWDSQLEQFAKIVLINAIANFEDFTGQLAQSATSNQDLQRKLSNSLQFPGGAQAISGAPTRDYAYKHFLHSSPALWGVFKRDQRSQRRYAGNRIDNLLVCFRFFKSLRNAIAHNGSRVDSAVLNNYSRFATVASTTALGLSEVPVHSAVQKLGDKIQLDLRGVTGLTNVILHIITTYDTDFGETLIAEREVESRVKASNDLRSLVPGDPKKRAKRILGYLKNANLPPATLTPNFEKFLKTTKILPSYI